MGGEIARMATYLSIVMSEPLMLEHVWGKMPGPAHGPGAMVRPMGRTMEEAPIMGKRRPFVVDLSSTLSSP